MNIRNWFKKKNKDLTQEQQIHLHVAGATVRHQTDFDNLESYTHNENLSKEFIDKWVNPYYFKLSKTNDKWVEHLIETKNQITDEIKSDI